MNYSSPVVNVHVFDLVNLTSFMHGVLCQLERSSSFAMMMMMRMMDGELCPEMRWTLIGP